MDLTVRLPRPHARQLAFIDSPAKRKVVRAGRRGGKTVGVAIYAVEHFLAGHRVLYGTPTQDQIDRFWKSAKRRSGSRLTAGVFYKNETRAHHRAGPARSNAFGRKRPGTPIPCVATTPTI
jgi:hypothetical protein